MKKHFLNLGKALSKAEQRSINGGDPWCQDLSPDPGTYLLPCGCFCQSNNQCIMGNCSSDGPNGWGMCCG